MKANIKVVIRKKANSVGTIINKSEFLKVVVWSSMDLVALTSIVPREGGL